MKSWNQKRFSQKLDEARTLNSVSTKLNEAEVVRQLERMKPHAKRVVALRYASMNLDRYRLSRSDAHANLEGQKQIAKMIAKEIE